MFFTRVAQTMTSQDVRWKQRFQNLEKAYQFLDKAVQLAVYDELQAAGLAHSFEFVFELSWKTLKDYFNFTGIYFLHTDGWAGLSGSTEFDLGRSGCINSRYDLLIINTQAKLNFLLSNCKYSRFWQTE